MKGQELTTVARTDKQVVAVIRAQHAVDRFVLSKKKRKE